MTTSRATPGQRPPADPTARRALQPDPPPVPGLLAPHPSLGDAGVGQEWAGTWEPAGTACTVRLVPLPTDQAGRRQAADIARRLTALEHPHLVPVLAVLETETGLAIVAAEVPGTVGLHRLLAARGRLAPGEAVTIGFPIAQALAAAHAAGVGHGELTAADILLEPNGRPHLAGVGVAALMTPQDGPPEAADVHALASLLRDAASKSAGPEAEAVAVAVASALIADPGKRSTAAELADSLARSTRPLPVQLTVSPPAPAAARRPVGAGASPARPAAPVSATRPPGGSRSARAGTGAITKGDSDAGATPPSTTARQDRPARIAGRGPRPAEWEPGAGRRGQTGATAKVAGKGPVTDRRPAGADRRAAAGPTAESPVPTIGDGHDGRDRAGEGDRTTRLDGPPARRSTGRRIVIGLAVLAAVAIVAGLLVVLTGGSSGGSGTAAPAAQSAESTWRTVLAGLETARGQAFAQANPALLADVDQNGSGVYKADLGLLQETMARGAHVPRLDTRIVDLRVLSQATDQVRLRVTEQLGAYDFVDAHGTVLAHRDAGSPATSDVTLIRTDVGWRIADRVPVP